MSFLSKLASWPEEVLTHLRTIEDLLTQTLQVEEHQMTAVDDLVSIAGAAVDALRRLEDLVNAGTVEDPRIQAVVDSLRTAVDDANTVDNDATGGDITPPTPEEGGDPNNQPHPDNTLPGDLPAS